MLKSNRGNSKMIRTCNYLTLVFILSVLFTNSLESKTAYHFRLINEREEPVLNAKFFVMQDNTAGQWLRCRVDPKTQGGNKFFRQQFDANTYSANTYNYAIYPQQPSPGEVTTIRVKIVADGYEVKVLSLSWSAAIDRRRTRFHYEQVYLTKERDHKRPGHQRLPQGNHSRHITENRKSTFQEQNSRNLSNLRKETPINNRIQQQTTRKEFTKVLKLVDQQGRLGDYGAELTYVFQPNSVTFIDVITPEPTGLIFKRKPTWFDFSIGPPEGASEAQKRKLYDFLLISEMPKSIPHLRARNNYFLSQSEGDLTPPGSHTVKIINHSNEPITAVVTSLVFMRK
jgi:hypothetical protein